jgi:transcriptional repressor NrdR
MNELMKLDKVAYIRFASVYKDFKDIDDFGTEINNIKSQD